MPIYIATITDNYPSDTRRDVYQGPVEEAAHERLEVELERSYPGQWDRFGYSQYTLKGSRQTDPPIASVHMRYDNLDQVKAQHIANWERKIADLRLAEWQSYIP
jgi:hypothetical protein